MTINGMDGLMETLCEKDLNECMNSLGACERIVNTPCLFIYKIIFYFSAFAIYCSNSSATICLFDVFAPCACWHIWNLPSGTCFNDDNFWFIWN